MFYYLSVLLYVCIVICFYAYICFVLTLRGGTMAFFGLFCGPLGRSGGHFDVILGLILELFANFHFGGGSCAKPEGPLAILDGLGGD